MLTKDHWLRRLAWALHALPAKDRNDIVLEARCHIEERIAQGHAEAQVLSSLGAPEEYARAFFEEFELSEALGSRAGIRMLRVAVQRVHRSLAAAFAMIVVFCLGVFGAGTVLTALMHFANPSQAGVWVGPGTFIIGHDNSAIGAHEVLGAGIYPFAMVCAYGSWYFGRLILLWALRTMAKR